MGKWRSFLDSLDTGGGQSFLLMFLILIGISVYRFLDSTAGGQIITLAFGAYLAKIREKGTNREQISAATTTVATTTQTTPSEGVQP